MRTLRSIVACLFVMLVGSTVWAVDCDGFTDVDSSSSFCGAVTYIKDHGITLGCGNGTTYCPNDFVTRLQMAAFLQRAGQADPSNLLGDHTTTIGGGTINVATGIYATVSGGVRNQATGPIATIAGGDSNKATGSDSAVLGGFSNLASGGVSTVLGGAGNLASGDLSIAAGYLAAADQIRCVVFSLWSDTNFPGMNCLGASNVFRVGADHGLAVDYASRRVDGGGMKFVNIGDLTSGVMIDTSSGATLTDAGVWTNVSDRAKKHNFVSIDTADVLARVAALPITRWEYNVESNTTHIGPVAQDFYAAFDVGANDKTITTIDESGVALAAIQGLNAKLEAQARELADLRARLAAIVGQRDVASSAR